MTYSILARDPATGSFGIAVQSAWFGVGRRVPHALAGKGAAITQAFAEPHQGQLALKLLGAGADADEVICSLTTTDPQVRYRQIAVVDSSGGAAAYTGTGCVRASGHQVGAGYSVQANMMRTDRVWPAMAAAYEEATGPLIERLLAALDAGQAAGGDFRGVQSAAVLVLGGDKNGAGEPLVDVRVDDHPDPLRELRRLVQVERAYVALAHGETSAIDLTALHGDQQRWAQALQAAQADDLNAARTLLHELFRRNPQWRDSVRAYGERGLFPHWAQLLDDGHRPSQPP